MRSFERGCGTPWRMSLELTEIEPSQVKRTDSPRKVEQEPERSAWPGTVPPSTAAEAHAQPQQLAEATSPPEASSPPSGDTLANYSASETVPDAQNNVTHKPSFSSSRSFSLHGLWTTVSTIG